MFRESSDIVGHPDFLTEAGKQLQVVVVLVGVLSPVWATKSSGVLTYHHALCWKLCQK